MARLVERGSEGGHSENGSIVRSWDAETGDFVGYPGGHPGFKERAEQVMDLLLRRKWLILLTCLLVMGGAAIYTYSQVPVYRASSLVLVEQENSSPLLSGSGSGGSGLFGSGNRSLQNELVVLRNSQSLRRRVAERLVTQEKAEQFLGAATQSELAQLTDRMWKWGRGLLGEKVDTIGTEGSSKTGKTEHSVAAVAAALPGHIRFSPSQQAENAIRITAVDEDPGLAALLANLYMREYVEFTRESSRAQVAASRKFLSKQAEERRQELQSVEREIQEYKQREGAIALDNEGSSLVSQISATEASLEEARVKMRMERTALESLQAQLDSIRPDQLSRRVGSSLQQEIEALQSKIADLKLSKQELLLQPGTPTVSDSAQIEQIERRIQTLRENVDSLSDKFVDEILTGGLSAKAGAQRVESLKRQISQKRIAITGLEARMDVLSNRLEQYEAELNSIPEKSMELAQLKRKQSYAQQMYAFINKELQKARIREKSKLGYASGVAEATPPGQPIRPQPRRNLILALILGLVGGIGLALGRDVLDNRVYKPDRVSEMGYHELGVVPNLTPLIEDQLEGKARVEHNGETLKSSLVTVVRPHSAAAEAYRQIRTRVQYGHSDEPRQTFLITSPGAGDGKSLTAANLAVATAQTGRSTLLIDTDLRRPRIHKLFGMSQAPGLVDAVHANLQKHLKTPSIDNLFVLPAGENEGNPSEVLSSSRFRKFLRMAKKHFDSVILDTSPVLATSDAPLLASQVDATLCIVRAGMTTEPELDRAMKSLGDVGARVTGVVFNGFDVSMAYGYKYRYRDYGQYGPYDQYSLPSSSD